MIQSGGFLRIMLGNLGKKVITDIAIPLDNLPGLGTNFSLNAINKIEKKISGQGTVIAGKEFTLFTPNEDMNITKIIKSLEDSAILTDGVTERVKHEINKQEGRFKRGVGRAGREYMDKNFYFCSIL